MMTENSPNNDSQPRKYKWRYGPLRLTLPWLSIAVGIAMVVKGAIGLGADGSGDPLFLILGSSLVVLGIVAFFVYRWMARRGM